jgi:hypothetical protein
MRVIHIRTKPDSEEQSFVWLRQIDLKSGGANVARRVTSVVRWVVGIGVVVLLLMGILLNLEIVAVRPAF